MKKISQKGFSIVEVMLAGFILTVGLIACANLVTSAMQNSMRSRDQIIATQLSQEGVELLRNIWENDTNNPRAVHGNQDRNRCAIDHTLTWNVDVNCMTTPLSLYTNAASGLYDSNSNGTETKFKRRIRLEDSGDDLNVESYVTWTNNSDNTYIVGRNVANCNIANSCVLTRAKLLDGWR